MQACWCNAAFALSFSAQLAVWPETYCSQSIKCCRLTWKRHALEHPVTFFGWLSHSWRTLLDLLRFLLEKNSSHAGGQEEKCVCV